MAGRDRRVPVPVRRGRPLRGRRAGSRMHYRVSRNPAGPGCARLRAAELEPRETPSVTIRLDYSYDTSGFFQDPARRAALGQVAADIGSHLETPWPRSPRPPGTRGRPGSTTP